MAINPTLSAGFQFVRGRLAVSVQAPHERPCRAFALGRPIKHGKTIPMQKMPKGDVEKFVRSWVSANVNHVPGLENLEAEIERLCAKLTRDARVERISGGELDKTLGNIDDFLTAEYQKIHEPEAGFRDA
jgi:hypothetical protein